MLTVCHMKKARQPFLPLKSTSLCRMLCCILTVPNPISFMTVLEEGVWDESHAFSFFLRSTPDAPNIFSDLNLLWPWCAEWWIPLDHKLEAHGRLFVIRIGNALETHVRAGVVPCANTLVHALELERCHQNKAARRRSCSGVVESTFC